MVTKSFCSENITFILFQNTMKPKEVLDMYVYCLFDNYKSNQVYEKSYKNHGTIFNM